MATKRELVEGKCRILRFGPRSACAAPGLPGAGSPSPGSVWCPGTPGDPWKRGENSRSRKIFRLRFGPRSACASSGDPLAGSPSPGSVGCPGTPGDPWKRGENSRSTSSLENFSSPFWPPFGVLDLGGPPGGLTESRVGRGSADPRGPPEAIPLASPLILGFFFFGDPQGVRGPPADPLGGPPGGGDPRGPPWGRKTSPVAPGGSGAEIRPSEGVRGPPGTPR